MQRSLLQSPIVFERIQAMVRFHRMDFRGQLAVVEVVSNSVPAVVPAIVIQATPFARALEIETGAELTVQIVVLPLRH